METLIATAFGRYVDIQRGEADQLTDAAAAIFKGLQEGDAKISPEALLVGLCEYRHQLYTSL